MVKKISLWAILATLVLVPFFLFEEDVHRLAESVLASSRDNLLLSALVLFLFLASDILLPVPSCLVSTACGSVLGVCLGFFVSFAAMTASSAIGYAIGRCSSNFAGSISGNSFSRLEDAERKFGPVFLFLMRPVPVLAESSVVYAGVCRYNMASSAFWVLLGNAAVSAFYAVLGACFS